MTVEHFLQIGNLLPEALLLVDAAGRILSANRAFVDHLGFRVEELRSRSLPDLVSGPPDDWRSYLGACARSRQLFPGTLNLRHGDGTVVACHCEAGLVRPRTGTEPALLLLRLRSRPEGVGPFLELNRRIDALTAEVARRRQLESSLRQSEERLRTMADAMPHLAWIAHANGYIHWYNQRWYEYTGATPQEMEGWGWQSVHDPEMLSQVMERWVASITTGEPFEIGRASCRERVLRLVMN